MSAPPLTLAILFADISGSTALYDKLGDQKARWLVNRCLSMLKGELDSNNGRLIKTIGDEILCTFPDPLKAMTAACAMQETLKKDNTNAETPLHIRIGFHFGDVISEDNDIFGDAVNVAARITSITRANQIMTTAAVVDKIPLGMHDKIRKITRADIRGKQEQMDIYQIMWEQDDMSSTRIGISAFRKPQLEHQLVVSCNGKKILVNEYNNKINAGREDSCHIVIKNEFVSRQHATLELRSGNFIITDHSSNGTYIKSEDSVTRLSRDNTRLTGSGIISLGQPFSDHPPEVVAYQVETIQRG